MLRNQGPRVIRQPIRGRGTPASRASAAPASPPAREMASFCVRRNDSGSRLWIGEQTAW
jgi:hypothetical protein